ncbi:hypothetical protein A0H81_09697 [Grifola frondosa]|uniref:Uncharacterized protein n=1 Tax=Grifola frondosa TaxID=5627 RepID=A0A1C7M180_GRIFR|nr:hypothetical protein A0H81_09697 [Grifola frondosa]
MERTLIAALLPWQICQSHTRDTCRPAFHLRFFALHPRGALSIPCRVLQVHWLLAELLGHQPCGSSRTGDQEWCSPIGRRRRLGSFGSFLPVEGNSPRVLLKPALIGLA